MSGIYRIEFGNLYEKLLREGRLFSAVTNHSGLSSGFNTLAAIQNPSASGKLIIVFGIEIQVNVATSAQMNEVDGLLYRNPTISANGSAVTPRNLLIGNSITPSANIRSGPTFSANGDLIQAGSNINAPAILSPFALAENNIAGLNVRINDTSNTVGIKYIFGEIPA